MDVYFPFLDGALGYDCARCGSKCCHGLGFGVGRSELIPLLRRRPEIAPFAQLAGAHAAVVDLTDEGCWLLAPDGRCRVELEDGRAAKPSVCRLFPFTRLHRVGETLVVEPHLLLCPLEDARGAGVRHDDLRADLATMGDEMALLRVTPPPGLPDDWVARESELRAATAEHLDARSSVALLSALPGPAREGELAALWQAWRRSFALDDAALAAADARLVRPLALLTPTLRFATLFGGGAPPYPRLLARLPPLLLGTALFAACASRALGGRAPSLRGIGELHRATARLRELLARWLAPTWLAEELTPPSLPAELAPAWARLVERLSRSEATPLAEAFDDAAAVLEAPLRLPLARALADRAGALRHR